MEKESQKTCQMHEDMVEVTLGETKKEQKLFEEIKEGLSWKCLVNWVED